MGQVLEFGTGSRSEFLHYCGKRVKTKSEKVLWSNFDVCRSYRGKTGRGSLFAAPSPPILNRVNPIDLLYLYIEIRGMLPTSRKCPKIEV